MKHWRGPRRFGLRFKERGASSGLWHTRTRRYSSAEHRDRVEAMLKRRGCRKFEHFELPETSGRHCPTCLCHEQPLPGGMPIDEFVTELERDPNMKERIERARAALRRSVTQG